MKIRDFEIPDNKINNLLCLLAKEYPDGITKKTLNLVVKRKLTPLYYDYTASKILEKQKYHSNMIRHGLKWVFTQKGMEEFKKGKTK